MVGEFTPRKLLLISGVIVILLGLPRQGSARNQQDFQAVPQALRTVSEVWLREENPPQRDMTPGGAFPEIGRGWRRVLVRNLQPDGQHNIWIKFRLPRGQWREPELFLALPVRDFQVYQNGRLLYRSRDGIHERRWSRSNLRLHFIRLDREAGPTVLIRIEADPFHYRVWGEFKLGERAAFIRDILRREFTDLVFAFIFIWIGLCLMTALIWSRIGYLPLLGIGFLTLCIGFMKIPELSIVQLLWDEPAVMYYGEAFSFYFLPVGFILYSTTFINFTAPFRAIRPINRGLMLAFMLHGLLMFALDVTGISPIDATYNFYVTGLAIVVVALMFTSIRKARKAQLDIGLIVPGTAALVLTGLHDIWGEISGALPCGRYLSGWGMLLFISGIILFMMKRFMGVHRELEELNQNLGARVSRRTAELEQVHQELGELNEELNSALQNLQETQIQLIQTGKMALLGNLVSGIAREINTPLGTIKSNVKKEKRMLRELEAAGPAALTETACGAAYLKDAARISPVNHKALAQMISLVKSLKNFARLDEAARKVADVHEGIDSTLLVLNHQFKGQVTIVKEYGAIPPLLCLPQQLNQVFLNLLLNARQAMEEDSGCRNGRAKQITIRTEYDGEKIIIRIKDTGPGIPTEALDQIFRPRFTTKENGAGLGLAICREIIDKHRGRIVARSEPGAGAEFIIELPVEPF